MCILSITSIQFSKTKDFGFASQRSQKIQAFSFNVKDFFLFARRFVFPKRFAMIEVFLFAKDYNRKQNQITPLPGIEKRGGHKGDFFLTPEKVCS